MSHFSKSIPPIPIDRTASAARATGCHRQVAPSDGPVPLPYRFTHADTLTRIPTVGEAEMVYGGYTTGVRLSNVTPRCSQRCGIASSHGADAAVPVASMCGRWHACGVAPKSALGTAICDRFRRDFCHLGRSVTEEGNIGSPSGAHHCVANAVTLPPLYRSSSNSQPL